MPPAWLIWLLPVPVATLAAIAWTSWTSRSRGPIEAADSVEAYERFRQAMATPVPEPRSGGRRSGQRAGSGS
jgi:hypothetical protein